MKETTDKSPTLHRNTHSNQKKRCRKKRPKIRLGNSARYFPFEKTRNISSHKNEILQKMWSYRKIDEKNR